MSNQIEPKLVKDKRIHILDAVYTDKGGRVLQCGASVLCFNDKQRHFIAEIYGTIFRDYSYDSYGKIFFDDADAANEAIKRIPTTRSTIYVIDGNNISQKVVIAIKNKKVDCDQDIVLLLSDDTAVSIKEIGKTVFTAKQAAESKLSNKES